MEVQPSNPIDGLGEHISNAISNAVSIAVEQGLQDVNLTNQAVLAFSAMSRTIGRTVAMAIKNSIEEFSTCLKPASKPTKIDPATMREHLSSALSRNCAGSRKLS
jgi:hypothetical protein